MGGVTAPPRMRWAYLRAPGICIRGQEPVARGELAMIGFSHGHRSVVCQTCARREYGLEPPAQPVYQQAATAAGGPMPKPRSARDQVLAFLERDRDAGGATVGLIERACPSVSPHTIRRVLGELQREHRIVATNGETARLYRVPSVSLLDDLA